MNTLPSDAPILLAYCWGLKNAGDLEITIGAVRLLRTAYRNRAIIAISRYAENEPEFAETANALLAREPGLKVIGSPFPWYGSGAPAGFLRIIASGLTILFYMLHPKLARILMPAEIWASINSAAMIFVNGGNLFYWNKARKSFSRIIAFSAPILWAIRSRKKYAILPQSFGPFQGGISRKLFACLFGRASFIMTRDPISYEHLRLLLGPARPVPMHVGLDLAFFSHDLDTEGAATVLRSLETAGTPFVALTVRATRLADTGPLSPAESELIIHRLKMIADHLLSTRRLNLLLVSQSIEDTAISSRIAEDISEKYPGRCHAVIEMRPSVLRGIYQKSLMLMAMRLHSLIFAATAGVPVVGFFEKEWGPKMPGTMALLGIGNRCYDIHESTLEQIFAGVLDVLENRAHYADRIKASVDTIIDAQERFLAERISECKP